MHCIVGEQCRGSCCRKANSWPLFADRSNHLILRLNAGEKCSSIPETTEIERCPRQLDPEKPRPGY